MSATADKQTFRKGDMVFYGVGNHTVRARAVLKETSHAE